MKLEELYLTLQERYSVEQEKKEAEEKAFKEALKNEILAIIQYAECEMNNLELETVYEAYEKAIEGQEDSMNVGIEVRIYGKDVAFDIKVGGKSELISSKSEVYPYDIVERLNNLLCKPYCYEISIQDFELGPSTWVVKKKSVEFDSKLNISLNESEISLKFVLPYMSEAIGREAEAVVEKFISDMKEIFLHSVEIQEPRFKGDSITLIFKHWGTGKNIVDEQILLDMSIDILKLTTRVHNALICNNIYTMHDLVELSETEFKSFRNVGTKSLDEVQQKLQEIDLKMKK